jgi:Asp-tRNA(Asn)/Glu-tRNA(Gln) amidotransferase A subunit family amidase
MCSKHILTSLTDDPVTFHGTPVGLQVMCRRLEEEKVLGLLGIISNALAQYRPTA